MTSDLPRCNWPRLPLDIAYHDTEWGVPLHDDRRRFEMLTLEGAQAGLSWSTVLAKRDGYARAFSNWDVERIARYTDDDIDRLMTDTGIIRNRAKIRSTIGNARAFLETQREFGSFDTYVWQFTGGVPLDPRRTLSSDIPARSDESDAMSKDLSARGFRFVGSTICYAYMQATGMINDHLVTCFRHPEVSAITAG